MTLKFLNYVMNWLNFSLIPRLSLRTYLKSKLLIDRKVKTLDDMKHAASYLNELGAKTVVVKGGNRLDGNKAIDVFYDGTDYKLFEELC